MKENKQYHSLSTTETLEVLDVNAAIGFVMEWKALRSMAELLEMAGDKVPTDIRLIEANNLQLIGSTLTGESVPVHKEIESVFVDTPLAERTPMLYNGTTVVKGTGEGVVVQTGMQTELGHISELTEDAQKETPHSRSGWTVSGGVWRGSRPKRRTVSSHLLWPDTIHWVNLFRFLFYP